MQPFHPRQELEPTRTKLGEHAFRIGATVMGVATILLIVDEFTGGSVSKSAGAVIDTMRLFGVN